MELIIIKVSVKHI